MLRVVFRVTKVDEVVLVMVFAKVVSLFVALIELVVFTVTKSVVMVMFC